MEKLGSQLFFNDRFVKTSECKNRIWNKIGSEIYIKCIPEGNPN